MYRVVKCCVVFLILASTLAASELQGVFSSSAEHTLPGLPVTFRVTLVNNTRHAVTSPRGLAIRVLTPSGQTVWPNISLSDERHWGGWPADYENLFVLEPGQQRVLEVPAYLNGFFQDERLAVPGRYQFQVVLSDTDENSTRAVVTNAVTITIEKPRGVDADVLRWMNEKADKVWGVVEWARFGDELAAEVFAHYPASQFAPYLFFSRPLTQSPARLDTLARYHEDGPYRDWIRYALVGRDIQTVRTELEKPAEKRDITRATRVANEVDRVINDLAQNTNSELLRLQIQQNREFIPTAAGVRAELAGRKNE